MKKLILAGLMAGLSIPAFAQELPDADPAMWVVKDEDTTIYMFGTFHMLDGKQEWFNDEVKTAFDASDELVLEAIMPENPAEMQPLVMKYAVDPEGETLTSKLTPEVKAQLDKELAALGIPAKAFDPLEPWFVSMTLSALGAQKMGLTGDRGPEMILSKAAKADNKPVSELEGIEWQLAMFDKMPEDQQIALLGQTVESVGKIEDIFKPMLTAWTSGDTEGLVEIMNEDMDESPELYKVMLSDRNATWAEWIDKRLDKPGTVFMAVGAGHLAGKDSVQDMLAARDISAERVPNAE